MLWSINREPISQITKQRLLKINYHQQLQKKQKLKCILNTTRQGYNLNKKLYAWQWREPMTWILTLYFRIAIFSPALSVVARNIAPLFGLMAISMDGLITSGLKQFDNKCIGSVVRECGFSLYFIVTVNWDPYETPENRHNRILPLPSNRAAPLSMWTFSGVTARLFPDLSLNPSWKSRMSSGLQAKR